MAKKKIKNKGKQVTKPAVVENINSDMIAAAYSAPTPPIIPVFIKVCRLCESKDGPFLNIFDAEQVTAKKIEELMPFTVTENDDLPHKICFRCSAKLEELYEFINRSIKTQENLREALGKTGPFLNKSKMAKKVWEASLSKSNMSNDDICDALIKKAMEGIKYIPLNPPLEEGTRPEPKRVTRSKETTVIKKEPDFKSDENEVNLKQAKLSVGKVDNMPPSKVTRSSISDAAQTEAIQPKKETKQSKKAAKKNAALTKKISIPQSVSDSQSGNKAETTVNKLGLDVAKKKVPEEEEKTEEPKKPFNIMDYISMIKVNGVGVLFQCKLCNRNFLKKEVVESHNCAKNGMPKVVPISIPMPEPPRVSTVKYIKIDGNMKKSLTEKIKMAEKSENEKKVVESKKVKEQSYVPHPPQPPPQLKPKPRIGPASKTRRNVSDTESSVPHTSETPNVPQTEPIPPTPSINFPAMPNLNGRFKLVPGPNNMFTLVEDNTAGNTPAPVANTQAPGALVVESKKSSRKRKAEVAVTPKDRNSRQKSDSPEVIDLDDVSQPYPVGLFQTVASRDYEQPVPEAPPTFTTPAMKKQSYTIVQTGNPSKLLISTKAKAVEVEVPKKRPKKNKAEVREDSSSKEPYRVTLEDVTPPKDGGFFTFINVDPLLQPSYVLPTDNIIQESQISTSSAVVAPTENKEANKYSCNMCGEHFSREKKLLTHIQSHFNKMDEEDQMRLESGKPSKKRGKK